MIDQVKLQGIKDHLLKLEELTGGKCRLTPRLCLSNCPIVQYAPDKDKNGCVFVTTFTYGVVVYAKKWNTYPIYMESDSEWWEKTLNKDKSDYLEAIQSWLKSRGS